jgi:predicted CoA-binding protein
MTDAELERVLQGMQVIAVVGMTSKANRAGHDIPKMLLESGFTVIPVNPNETEVLGQRAYATLAEVPVAIDLVDVFRRAELTPPIAREAAAIGAKVLWLQSGIVSAESRSIAEAANMTYVEDACLGVAVRRLRIRGAGTQGGEPNSTS